MTSIESKPNQLTMARVLEHIQVLWQNWKVRKTGRAYRRLCKAMRNDPGYAISWHANISMPIFDKAKGKLTIHEANTMADDLMRHLFDVKMPPPEPCKLKSEWRDPDP